jgi:hypothetical protein
MIETNPIDLRVGFSHTHSHENDVIGRAQRVCARIANKAISYPFISFPFIPFHRLNNEGDGTEA